MRQAHELNIDIPARLRTLLIHGFLHLIGYDHERSPADARRMFARERALASKIDASTGRSQPSPKKRIRKSAVAR